MRALDTPLLTREELMALDTESLVEKVIGLRNDLADDAEELAGLRAALATAERERDEARAERDAYRERDAFLMNERIAVATALDVPYATPLGEAVATRLARLTAERDASREAHATLAAAVATVRDARAVVVAMGAQYNAAWDAASAPPTASQSEGIAVALRASYEAGDALSAALDALLAAAPPRSTVPARVAREYLAALDGRGSGELADDYSDAVREVDARAALDAALAGCV